MSQKKYIGMDVHQVTISVAAMDGRGKHYGVRTRNQGEHGGGVRPRITGNSGRDV
jgi:hypothetical protein